MTDTLLPCPFCGGEADLQGAIGETEKITMFSVVCHNCGIGLFMPKKWRDDSSSWFAFNSPDEAVTAWNTRTHAGYSLDEETVSKLIDAYIKSTERTCEYIGDEISGGCSECRGWLDPACAYCPSCGAKVVR